jgi:propionyl-CoA carboxylase alpha chain
MDDGDLVDIIGRWVPGQRLLSVTVDGRHRIVQVRRAGRDWELQTRGASHKVKVLSPHVAELSKYMLDKPAPDLSRLLLAPMPGLLTRLDVAIGDKVEPGQPVAVMEAMKMENILRAPKAATVKATPAKAGDSLAVDQVIVEFE